MIPIKVLTELETKVNRPTTHVLLVPTSPAQNSPFVTIMHISSPYTPTYISSLIEQYIPKRSLRSSSKHLLKPNTARLISYGERSFQFAAPSLWNSLPEHIRKSQTLNCFKSNLKTYLFKKYYEC